MTPKDPKTLDALQKSLSLPRRGFLQALAGAAGIPLARTVFPVSAVQMLVQGSLSRAFAQSQARTPRSYVDVWLGGGFHASYFYLPLAPYGSQEVLPNAGQANQWKLGAPVYEQVTKTIDGQSLRMPGLWAMNLPRPGGGSVDSANLLAHSIFCRGIVGPLDGHEVNAIQTKRPSPTAPSITGMVADRSSRPIPAVQMLESDVFQAQVASVKKILHPSFPNPLEVLLEPFRLNAEMQNLLAKRENFSAAFQAAVAASAQDAKVTGMEEGLLAVSNAETLFRRNFGNLTDVFSEKASKYAALILASNDLRLPDGSLYFSEAINPATNSSMRSVTNRGLSNSSDFRTIMTDNPVIGGLAEGFAIAEFLLENELSQSLTIDAWGIGRFSPGPGALSIPFASGGPGTSMGLDMHADGTAVVMPILTFWSRAVMACVYELSQALGTTKFSETVIKIGSEFPRNGRADGGGSDHAWQAQAFALVSGAIQSPAVLGNIYRGDSSGPYAGTWGRAAKITHEGSVNTILNLGHAASTICETLRIPSPNPNFEPIVRNNSSDLIVPAVALAENKETLE